MANYGGRVPRAFDGIETTIRDFEKRIRELERLRNVIAPAPEHEPALLYGIGPPDLAIGERSDFYIDYVDWILYGPKMMVEGWANQVALGNLPQRRFVSFGGGLINPGENRYDMALLNRTERVLRVWNRGEFYDFKPARIRAYSSADYRDLDLDRDVMDDPPHSFTGLLFEVTGEQIDMGPVAHVYAKDDYGSWPGESEFEVEDDDLQPVYFTTTSYSPYPDDLLFTTLTVARAE